jgi:DNA-binding Lrp family transcriptional regulator
MFRFQLWVKDMPHISKHQRKILKILEVKPEMTTKEIAEVIFGRLIECRTKEYSSINRSLRSLEREDILQRVYVQLRWRRTAKAAEAAAQLVEDKSVLENAA